MQITSLSKGVPQEPCMLETKRLVAQELRVHFVAITKLLAEARVFVSGQGRLRRIKQIYLEQVHCREGASE
jgi:hypothetical protein